MEKPKVDERSQRQNEELARITDQLDLITQQQINRLPERVFVSTFLPFFSGERQADDKVNISVWGGIAGNGYLPVDIVDDKTSEVLSVVHFRFIGMPTPSGILQHLSRLPTCTVLPKVVCSQKPDLKL